MTSRPSPTPRRTLSAALACSTLTLAAGVAIAQAPASHDAPDPMADTATALAAFAVDHPDARLLHADGRITRVFGTAFAQGDDPVASAERFRLDRAAIFGIAPEDLVPIGPAPSGAHVIPVLYEAETGEYRFTAVHYTQWKDGLPVHGGQLRLLVRNDAGAPLVLAAARLHDLHGFTVDPGAVAALDGAALDAAAADAVGPEATVQASAPVIYAGDEATVPARLAWRASVSDPPGRWEVVVDATTGAELARRSHMHDVDVSGQLDGMVTQGLGADICDVEAPEPIPYARVVANGVEGETDANGSFVIPGVAGLPLVVTYTLDGAWFDIIDFAGDPLELTLEPGNPGAADALLNADNLDPFDRAQVNAYVGANQVRDYVLAYNPAYPTLDQPDYEVNVNRTDGYCPGNAWFEDFPTPSINFCQAGDGAPNTSFSSIIYHEFGHHLVYAAGSGQLSYGEGMSDCVSVLLLDNPLIAPGFFGDCGEPLRTADNECQFSPSGCSSCGQGSHDCGNLLSGCIWSLRQELAATNPETYRDILSSLTINSILLHTGTTINSAIAVDFLTLDDDDADLSNGTPHYAEIQLAFSAHGMGGPEIPFATFSFPEGRPGHLEPAGTTTMPVVITPLGDETLPGSGTLHWRLAGSGGGFETVPMEEVSPGQYLATFPAAPCAAQLEYFVSVLTATQQMVTSPALAPTILYQQVVSSGAPELRFEDTFATDLGWTITDSPSLSDGTWERSVPTPGCDRGAPDVAADESPQCYLTADYLFQCNSDIDGGSTVLESPALDAGDGDAYVSYWRWYSNVEGTGAEQDPFIVEISGDDGASWTTLEVVGPDGPEVQGGWIERQFRIGDHVEPTGAVRLRFTAEDTPPSSVVEAAVDGVRVIRPSCTGVFGDLDGDGVVDGADLGLLLGQWGGAGSGDLDGSGTVDGADLGLLLGAWG